jgi:hypothetical protein
MYMSSYIIVFFLFLTKIVLSNWKVTRWIITRLLVCLRYITLLYHGTRKRVLPSGGRSK